MATCRSFGGLAVGEGHKPDDIVGGVERCIDMMDCVLPSRAGGDIEPL